MTTPLRRRTFWDIVRPLHSPVTKMLRKRLGQNYADHPEMALPPPYEALGIEVERHLHRYLHVTPDQIERIVIVGANGGDEMPRMRQSYPRSRFLAFEPSPRWFAQVNTNYGGFEYVDCRELALSDRAGTATFHELPMDGNGSLLRPDMDRWTRVTQSKEKQVTSFEVRVSTLDQEAAAWDRIDLLWVDVQGAEGKVLAGGMQTLNRVAAVFLEVWLTHAAYEGGPLFPEIDALLQKAGFTCVGLGVDGWNFTGNALWIRDPAGKACQPTDGR
jgi:FkbM family methyltransferase